VQSSRARFILTHNYTGYPLIRQARDMVARGDLGEIRLVQAEYAQDWLTETVEAGGTNKQAAWRTDPAQAGAGALGDIGTHAFNLLSFVTGLRTEALLADLQSFGAGRRVDDNAHVILRFAGGARGMLWASQVAPGNENGLRLRIYGTRAGIEWEQENPNRMTFAPLGEAKRILTRGGAGLGTGSNHWARVPPGLPEGYLEAFATVYARRRRPGRRYGRRRAPARHRLGTGGDVVYRGVPAVVPRGWRVGDAVVDVRDFYHRQSLREICSGALREG
jgi:predicted dehydrogenase